MLLKKNNLEDLKKNLIYDLAKFIVKENYNHHSGNSLPIHYKAEINTIYREDINLSSTSEIFTGIDSTGNILGVIRILKWNYDDVLPIQKIFKINPLLVIDKTTTNIYHIGRFAIKNNVCGINLFKRLLLSAAEPICNDSNNVAFAECDSKLLRILNLLGIETTVIGEPIHYLGSETIPIKITSKGLIDFYRNNKYLINRKLDNASNLSIRIQKHTTNPIIQTA